MDQQKKTLGRKPGSLVRCTCCICSTVEISTGTGGRYRCKACKAKGLQNVRHPGCNWLGKDIASAVVHAEVRAGNLPHPTTLRCDDCLGPASEYEHRDYNKPLVVVPICRSCNLRRGPAIPVHGTVVDLVRDGRIPYRLRRNALRVLVLMGQPTHLLDDMPTYLEHEHWVRLLPLFERTSALEA